MGTPKTDCTRRHSAGIATERNKTGFSDFFKTLFPIVVFSGLLVSGAAYAGSLSIGPFNQGVYSGTGPFNVTGTCTDPGDDCGADDTRVRTADLIQYSWSIAAADIAPGDADFESVVLEQTITPGTGADIKFEEIPTICLAPPQGSGGTDPLSSITENPDGSQTLLCNLGKMGNGEQLSFSVPVRPLATSVNGATFTSSQFVYALDADGNKVVQNVVYSDNNVYEISAAPAFDLIGNRRAIYRDHVASYDLGTGNGPEQGYVFYWTAHIAADQERAGKGVEALSNEFSFNPGLRFTKSDGVTPFNPAYKIVECVPNNSTWGNAVFGKETYNSNYPLESKVVDSGTCAYSGDHTTGYTMTVSGADTTGSRYPRETINGSSLLAGPYFVASYRLRVWIPFSAIDAEDGIPDNNVGAVKITSCLSDFDPNSQSGISNYAGATEPGYNGTAMPDGGASNNCTGPVDAKISVGGSFNHRLVSTADDKSGFSYKPLLDTYHTGTAIAEPGMAFVHWSRTYNNGSVDFNNATQCVIFDNTVTKLTDRGNTGATPGKYAYIADYTGGGFDHTQWKVQYGTAPLSGDDPLDGDADSSADFNPVSGRYEGNWSAQKAMRCDNPAITNWNDDPNVIGLDNINIVRLLAIDPDTTQLAPGQYLWAYVPLEMRDSFNGGPHDGTPIPVGTVAAAISTFKSDEFYSGWRSINYQPSPENSSTDGDRVTLTRANVNVAKSTLEPASPAGTPSSTLAGNNVIWQLDPTVSSQLPEGTTAINMSVTDILPSRLSYNASCTTQQPGGRAPTLVEYNTPNPGETRLTWSLGDLTSTDSISSIVFCTSTDPLSPGGTVVINQATANADNAVQSEPVYQSVALGQAGNIQATVSVDVPLDDPDDEQQYTLGWYNFSTAGTVQAPTVINVLPYNGDNAGLSSRNPASSFSGSLSLTGEPLVTFSDGSVPADGEPVLGVLYYSADTPSTIDHNPDNNASNWCEFDGTGFVGHACPASWNEVTAIKHVSNYEMQLDGNPRQGFLMSYALQANGNTNGDIYTNVFGVDSASLPAEQFITAKSSSVIVASYSIGDLVFVDMNANGVYDSSSDLPAPDGVKLELYRTVDDSLVGSTTTSNGRFLFDRLSEGDYYLKIPASLFKSGGKLQGWDAATGHKAANDDANQEQDHSGFVIGSAAQSGVLTDTISLSASPPANPSAAPAGDEPVGDNVLGVSDPNTNDDFSNLTIDIGLVTGDADSDGIPDIIEFGSGGLDEPGDSDGDGTADYLDTDSDADGIPDSSEAGSNPDSPRDSDNDGSADTIDRDSDGDGIPDALEGSADSDNDGKPDYLDTDSDNDGIDDGTEASTGADSDGDGIIDLYDVDATGGEDANGDGVDDAVSVLDTDGDGNPDYRDNDSDGDGIPDDVESSENDADGDGMLDHLDPDTDGDGIPDALEGLSDQDGDGVADYLDRDSDNDGISDFIEVGSSGIDSDGDGIEDVFDVDSTGGEDADGDGIDDAVAAAGLRDTDADGIADHHDLDSDNDGLTDTRETGGTDADANGLIDGFSDGDGDGLDDTVQSALLAIPDTDADGEPDYRDLDSDSDGISDLVEAGGIDADADGRIDAPSDADNDGLDDNLAAAPLPVPDTDGDGTVDVLDLDSDGDGISDAIEGLGDTDNDGLANYLDGDSDADGLADSLEGNVDTDGDGIANFLDIDSDDDGIADAIEGANDYDNDGQADYLDTDADGDGIADSLEGNVDTDGDGTSDFRDLDADGDSIADSLEGAGDADTDGAANFRDLDADDDGIADAIEGANDFDNDGQADYLDTDADGDGIADSLEGNVDTDGDGNSDFRDLDADGDGLGDQVEGIEDTDSDGAANFRDTDSDDDGLTDSMEGTSDADGDGAADYLDSDSDNDGIDDSAEGAADSDADGVADYLDQDSDADGIDDSDEKAVDSDGDGIADYLDRDSDNDGIDDGVEGAVDSDGDGVADYLDGDSDADGIDDG
ncbi:MAG: hypothetical protein KDJ38_12640, partial [Gammaproteobacteria bacterium]|nr:hypothetical protein [Gammaproteobacteria bacterium]